MRISLSRRIGYLKYLAAQVPGFHTSKRLVVFQSDDWGSLRVGTRQALVGLAKKGLFTDDPYIQKDTIASAGDLSRLFTLLNSCKDDLGKHPVFTANTNVANPDFEAIRQSGYEHYIYEPFTKTIERLGDRGDVMSLWNEGISAGVFEPQFHGREHLNTRFWMTALQNNHTETRIAFDYNSYGLMTYTPYSKANHYLAALDFQFNDELCDHMKTLLDGVVIFRNILGFSPVSFMAPQYIWHPEHEAALGQAGIHYIQTNRIQKCPKFSQAGYEKIFRFSGQMNSSQQVYLARNCVFEPAFGGVKWVDNCMRQIQMAFLLRKPAIISTHRLNYVSTLDRAQAEQSLCELKALLDQILQTWPDVNFISTAELGKIMHRDNHEEHA